MRELLIATRNKGKYPEMVNLLTGLPFTFKNPDDVPELSGFDADETGETFEANAEIKAREYGKRAGMLTIADDSGVCIDALGGEPGVRSARYAEGTDKARYEVVLEKMREVPEGDRAAQFVSVIAVYDPLTDRIVTTRGQCAGHILFDPRGERGFGYDPIFHVDEIGKTYAEATLEEKQSVDHRSKAMHQMRTILEQFV